MQDDIRFSFTLDHGRIAEFIQAIRSGESMRVDRQNDLANLLAAALGFFWEDRGTPLDLKDLAPFHGMEAICLEWRAQHALSPHTQPIPADVRNATSALLQFLGWRARLIAECNDFPARIVGLQRQIERMHELEATRPDEVVEGLDSTDLPGSIRHRMERALAVERAMRAPLQEVVEGYLRRMLLEPEVPGLLEHSAVRVSIAGEGFTVVPVEP